METQIDDKKYYEEIERQIIKEATTNGVSFEEAALIKREIKNEGLKDFAFCEMLRNQLAAKQNEIRYKMLT